MKSYNTCSHTGNAYLNGKNESLKICSFSKALHVQRSAHTHASYPDTWDFKVSSQGERAGSAARRAGGPHGESLPGRAAPPFPPRAETRVSPPELRRARASPGHPRRRWGGAGNKARLRATLSSPSRHSRADWRTPGPAIPHGRAASAAAERHRPAAARPRCRGGRPEPVGRVRAWGGRSPAAAAAFRSARGDCNSVAPTPGASGGRRPRLEVKAGHEPHRRPRRTGGAGEEGGREETRRGPRRGPRETSPPAE